MRAPRIREALYKVRCPPNVCRRRVKRASHQTVPANGDVNPYGVAFVPPGFPPGGILRPGDVIVANFNNSANLQGTGTTIVRVNAGASPSLFFRDPAKPGFSTALAALERGFVLVGTVPSSDGSGVCTAGPNGEPVNVGKGDNLSSSSIGTATSCRHWRARPCSMAPGNSR